MTVSFDIQRRRDGAFFEDWRPWRSLVSEQFMGYYNRYAILSRPSYHCRLLERVGHLGRCPAFEIAIPENGRAIDIVKALPGATRLPKGATAAKPVQVWYVPAEHWEAVRKALPAIKTIVTEYMDRTVK